MFSFLHTIIEGVFAGLTLSMMLGPAFFTLLQTSLEKGFRPAVRLAMGIFLSDAFLVTVSILGASRLFNDPAASKVIGVVGGISLMLIGIYTFKKKVAIREVPDNRAEIHLPSRWREFFKGFFMNMANPATWIFWFVTVGTISAQYTTDSGQVLYYRVILFFVITLCTVFSMDVLKSFIANRIKRVINDRTVSMVNKIVGVLLVLFGIYLFVASFIPLDVDSVSGGLNIGGQVSRQSVPWSGMGLSVRRMADFLFL